MRTKSIVTLIKEMRKVKKDILDLDFYDATDGYRWNHSEERNRYELTLKNLRLRIRTRLLAYLLVLVVVLFVIGR